MNSRTLKALEFDRILEHLASYSMSDASKEHILALRPILDLNELRAEQILFEEARDFIAETSYKIISFLDISSIFEKIKISNSLLEIEELWALKEVLIQAADLVRLIAERQERKPALAGIISAVPQMTISALSRCVQDELNLRDESSPELLNIRTELRRLHQSCLRKVKDFANEYNIMHYLQDDFMTLASDRYVLPLKSNFKGRLQGIIHDYSGTGETCYFEPMFLVEVNNKLQELKHTEREEERKILIFLKNLILSELEEIESAWQLLIKMDILNSKTVFANKLGANLAQVETNNTIFLKKVRHPLLAIEYAKNHNKIKKEVQPIDIELHEEQRILVVSGGNAGGKTVSLKSLGLVTLMSLAAIPVPIEIGGRLPFIDNVHAFIGDEQSIDEHVSSFTGQIKHLADIWHELSPQSLLLLDEFAVGTDPSQGAALAQALLDELLDKNVYVMAATHFPALKTYALTHEGVRAASVLFDPQTKKALFELAYDQVGASLALDVARENGLSEAILRKAQQYLLLDNDDITLSMDKLNQLAVERKNELDKLKQEQEKVREKRLTLQKRFEEERKKLADELRKQAAELMQAFKDSKISAKQAVKEMSKLRANLHNSAIEEKAVSTLIIKTNENYLYKPFNKQARVLELDNKQTKAKIDLNGLSLWVAISDLDDLQGAKTSSGATVRINVSKPKSMQAIDIRGKRADIALAELEQFLDRAIISNSDGVEVIHGRGTGALRKAVHTFLKSYPQIASFNIATEEHGGDGMTEVIFR